jgi:hypothetical protein
MCLANIFRPGKNVYVFANILEKQIGKNNRKNFEKKI